MRTVQARCAILAAVLLLAPSGCARKKPAETPPSAPPAEPRPVKVALVLGGGGARGFAHVGVIRVLEQEKIPVDLIVGTSVGSLIGALYADTRDAFALEAAAWTVRQEDLFDWSIFSLGRGPVTGNALEAFVRQHVRSPVIERLPVPFAAVATDIVSGQQVVIDRGDVAAAVHASSAIPGVFRPVGLDGRILVDGGVLDPIPVSVARARGADVVLAVDIGVALVDEEPGNAASVALRSVAILTRELSRVKVREADVVISPAVGDASPFDFERKRDLMAAGVAAAKSAVPAIREAIRRASLRPPASHSQ